MSVLIKIGNGNLSKKVIGLALNDVLLQEDCGIYQCFCAKADY